MAFGAGLRGLLRHFTDASTVIAIWWQDLFQDIQIFGYIGLPALEQSEFNGWKDRNCLPPQVHLNDFNDAKGLPDAFSTHAILGCIYIRMDSHHNFLLNNLYSRP